VKENTIIFTVELVDLAKRESIIVTTKEFRISQSR
jgi:hypothetical protein